jgi:hypothetical protein
VSFVEGPASLTSLHIQTIVFKLAFKCHVQDAQTLDGHKEYQQFARVSEGHIALQYHGEMFGSGRFVFVRFEFGVFIFLYIPERFVLIHGSFSSRGNTIHGFSRIHMERPRKLPWD